MGLEAEVHKVQIRLELVRDLLASMQMENAIGKEILRDSSRILTECIESLQPLRDYLLQPQQALKDGA